MTEKGTIVVTGGAGFLGSHLCPALVKEGYSVHVVDTLVAGKREHVPEGAVLHEIDIRNVEALRQLFGSLGPITGLFHLAALPRVQYSIDYPVEAHDVNINGAMNVLLAARDAKVGRVVYSASSSAYGDQDTLPLHEKMLPQPKSPYALQKYTDEHYCRVFSEVYGLPTVSLRYFNLYGPNSDPNGPYAQAIIKFLYQRKEGKPITITGDGEQTRDCVHVSDVVRANILALTSPNVGKGEVINIGSGEAVSINEIARMVGGETVHIEPRIEPRHTRADITKAKELLGWSPAIRPEDGIAELKASLGIV
ncbi:NAD-dependent epimerase/dehydratase family protein [Patescibacteria group bacterium]|nr:NAD-dependent epimerase/dehydratase family protein [Patescibacteria group bacterium]